MPTHIKLVCFDWGGVILRICRNWPEACAAASIPVHPGSESGETAPQRRQIVQAHQEGRLSFTDYTRALAQTFDNLYTPDQIAAVHDAWLLHEYPGIPQLIAQLHDRPTIQTALLSNTNQRHLDRGLTHFPTAHTLHHPLYSHRLALSKPNPAFYNALTTRLALTPQSILFFDDLPENIAAARALHWNAVLIDPLADPAAQIRTALTAHAIL